MEIGPGRTLRRRLFGCSPGWRGWVRGWIANPQHLCFSVRAFSLRVLGNYQGQTKWDKPSRIRRFSLIFAQIFADFPGIYSISEAQRLFAENRGKPQKTADFRRNRFVPFSSSLLVSPYLRVLESWMAVRSICTFSILWSSLKRSSRARI